MTNNYQPKNDSLEALDFIMSVLKEHEKDLDKTINELFNVAEQFGKTGELTHKVEQLEEKIDNLQKEVSNLIITLSSSKTTEPSLQDSVKEQTVKTIQTSAIPLAYSVPSVILQCKKWEDFQKLAFQASTLSFTYKEDEKTLQADAIKGNQIIKYAGVIPNFSDIFKSGLSKQLDITENNIFEGVLEKI